MSIVGRDFATVPHEPAASDAADLAGAPLAASRQGPPAGAPGAPLAASRQEPPGLARPRPARRRRRHGRRLALAAIAAAAVVGGALAVRYGVPVSADHYPVLPQPFAVELAAPATLHALRQTSVAAGLAGQIATLRVDEDDVVAAGDVIATLDESDLRSEYAAARASEEAARLAVVEAEAELARARAARTEAAADHARAETLHQRGVAARATFDDTASGLAQADAGIDRAEAAVLRARAEHQAAAARTALSRAALEDAVVRAPISGVVVSRDVNVGDTVGAATPLVTIADPASIVLSARLDESAIADVRAGQPAMVRFASGAAPVAATVLRRGRTVDTETREFTVDVAPAELPAGWALGQRARVVIAVAEHPDTLAAPTAALARRDGTVGVWVADEGRARWRPVTLGGVGGGAVEILGGIQPGEVVIEAARPYEGMRLTPRSAS